MSIKSSINKLMLAIFFKVQNFVKNKMNLKELMRQFNAHGNAIVKVEVYYDRYFTDLVFEGYFKLGEDTIIKLDNPQRVDGIVKTDYNTILNLLSGKITREYGGKKYEESFGLRDALREGRIILVNLNTSDYLGDLLLFEKIYLSLLPTLKDEVGKYL